MYSSKEKEIVNNVHLYYRLFRSRTISYLNENPEVMETLSSFFSATGFDPMKPSHQTAAMTGASERTVRRFYGQQTERESLEPQKHVCGRKRVIFPDWCFETIRLIILCKLFLLFCHRYILQYTHGFGIPLSLMLFNILYP